MYITKTIDGSSIFVCQIVSSYNRWMALPKQYIRKRHKNLIFLSNKTNALRQNLTYFRIKHNTTEEYKALNVLSLLA